MVSSSCGIKSVRSFMTLSSARSFGSKRRMTRHLLTGWPLRPPPNSSPAVDCLCRRWNSTRTLPSRSKRIPVVFSKDDFHVDDGEDDDDNDDDDDVDFDGYETSFDGSPLPWKTLLQAPSRAAWRVSSPHLPTALQESFDAILQQGDRTPKQLKRAHRKVLERHQLLAEFRERERRRLVNGKYYRGKDAAAGVDDANNNLLPVYYGYDETLATLKHRLVPNYATVRRVLEETQSLLGGPDKMAPKRIVDFGIGCGSASVAALDLFRNSIEWIHGIDPSQPMRDCSQKLIEGMAERDGHVKKPPRITFSTGLSQDSTTTTAATAAGGASGSFDLALLAYSATDLLDITSSLAAAAMLFEKLKPSGILVMIEPGTPDGFNSIRGVRNMLLDCCPPEDPDFEWQERCHILAPCTHNGSCPMVRHKKDYVKKAKLAHDLPQELDIDDEEEAKEPDYYDGDFVEMSSNAGNLTEFDAFNSSFCSFVQTIPGSDSRKGEKFSYLVVQKRLYGQKPDETDSFGEEDNLSHLLAQAQGAAAQQDDVAARQIYEQLQELESRYLDSDEDDLGLELLRGDAKRHAMGRIVRAPIKKKGHVYIDYCAAPGRIIRSRVAKSSTNAAPGVWSAARKSRWGGFWPDTMDKIYFPAKK